MSQAEEIFGRVIEIYSLYNSDPLKSDASRDSYDNEFRNLQPVCLILQKLNSMKSSYSQTSITSGKVEMRSQ